MIVAEEWRAIPGWEGLYEVSSLGRVKSLERKAHRTVYISTVREKILKPQKNPEGYYLVRLCRGDVKELTTIHRLVMLAFVGPRTNKAHICHNDGDIKNNSLDNLRYDTPAGNAADRWTHGTEVFGERVWSAKLTPKQVLEIFTSTESHASTARKFGVKPETISGIRHRRKWTHLTQNL